MIAHIVLRVLHQRMSLRAARAAEAVMEENRLFDHDVPQLAAVHLQQSVVLVVSRARLSTGINLVHRGKTVHGAQQFHNHRMILLDTLGARESLVKITCQRTFDLFRRPCMYFFQKLMKSGVSDILIVFLFRRNLHDADRTPRAVQHPVGNRFARAAVRVTQAAYIFTDVADAAGDFRSREPQHGSCKAVAVVCQLGLFCPALHLRDHNGIRKIGEKPRAPGLPEPFLRFPLHGHGKKER